MSKHDEYVQQIADRLLEQIKNNEAPWQKPWEAGRSYDFVPVNSEGKPYRGANLINLSSQATAKGYTDNRWYTFYGAKKAGGKVKKGEKGTPIHYWKFHEDRIKKDENGNKVYDDKGKPVKIRVELDHPRVFYTTVFNAEQIEGVPEKKFTAPVMEEWERHKRCESIIENYDVEVIHKPQDRAYYHPHFDHVVMPERGQFKSADLYYATLLHELAHSSGHESRLNRDMGGGFGSEQYAKEELRAEIASMFLGQELQIGHDPSQHIAYLESWAKVVKDDPKEIFKAVKDADAINQYLLSFDKGLERSAESDIAKEVENQQEQNNLEEQVEVELEEVVKTNEAQVGLPPSQENETETEANIATKNTYLYVPFEEKDEAKALGAKWDKENKSWYAPQGSDLDSFSRWREAPVVDENIGANLSPEAEFAQYLESQGVVVKAGHPKLDGKWHRLPMASDKKGNLNASYVVHIGNGIPRGYFKDFHSGFEEKWVSEQRTGNISKTSSIDLEKIRAEAEARQKAEYDEVGDIASKLYKVAEPVNPNHKYLNSKGVTAEGGVMAVPPNDNLPEELKDKLVIGVDWREAMALRKDPNEERIVLTKGDILLPVQNKDGDIRSVQTIAENGFKGYLKGGEKGGNYTTIGEIEGNKPFMIVEGWATGKTINEQTKIPVVVAFDKNNLTAVAETMREKHPDNRIYIGADNDHQQEAKYKAEGRTGAGGELNGGIEKANEASEKINGYVLVPEFEPTDKGSDWNDVFVDKGAEAFKQQMREQVVKYRDAEEVKKQSIPTMRTFTFNDPELTKVQAETISRVTQDTQGLIEDYKAMNNTFNGRYVSSDMFKEVFKDYNQSPQHRSKFDEAVKGASEQLASELFKQTMQKEAVEGKDTIVLLTGATGSGKTSTILNDGKLEANVALIYENELDDDYKKLDTMSKVEQALSAGYKVDIVAVHPKPEQALENTWKRFNNPNDGRGALIDSIAKSQANTYDSLKAINDRFGDKINLTVIDKTGGNADLNKQIGWDKLNVLKSEGTEKQILEKLEKHLAQEYKKGSINYDTLKQSVGTDERAKQISSRLDRQTDISSNPNERGRELSPVGDSKSNELGQTHTSEVGRSNKTVTITSLRDRLKNNKALDNSTKQHLDVIISAVEHRFRGDPDLKQDKLKEINSKINELEKVQQLESIKPQAKDTGMSR